jgi:hypothetical protein
MSLLPHARIGLAGPVVAQLVTAGNGTYPVINSQCDPITSAAQIPVELLSPVGVLTAPVVVSVNWPGATEVALDIRTLFPDFVEDIFQTPSWDALMTQYVGSVDAVYAGSYDLDSLITLAPTNSLGSDFAGPEIAAQIASGALPPSAENLIYVVHVPPGIEIFDSDPGGVGVSCEDRDFNGAF